jgi:DNA-binding XRE family transcriptional regulator
MPKNGTKSLQGQRQRSLLKAVKALIDELRTNDWPLGAKDRPLTWLGDGDWTDPTKLTPKELEEDPNRPSRIVADKEREARCHHWRGRLRTFLEDSQRHVNDYGDSEHMRRFANNKLVGVDSTPEPLFREMYRTAECLRDLESLEVLIESISPVRPKRRRHRRRSDFPKRLRQAREAYGHTQEQAAAQIGVPQSVYSLYETGMRRPGRKNAQKCERYIEEAPKPTPTH